MQENFKNQIGEILQNHKKAFIIYITLMIFCFTYYIIWNRIGNIYQELLENNSVNNLNIEYRKIEKYGFPFYIKFQITDPKVSVNKFSITLDLKSDVIFIENPMFSKTFNIYLNKITSTSKDKTQELFFDKDTNIKLTFSKFSLIDILVKSKEIKFVNDININNEVVFKDLIFKEHKLENDTDDIVNILLDVKHILLNKIEDKKSITQAKLNALISINSTTNIYKDIMLSTNITLEKLIINNITSNYGLTADANYKKNMQTSVESGSTNLKFINFPNLIKANQEIKNQQINTLISVFSALNKHPNDTENDKIINIIKNETSEEILVNNENFKDLLMRILPLIQQLVPIN